MKHKFKFQKILDLKIKQEDDKKNQISVILKQIEELKEEITQVMMEQKDQEQQKDDKSARGATILEIRSSSQYISFLEKKINRLKFELSSFESNLQIKRNEYLELRKEKKSYENLKEKENERLIYKEKKDEEKLIDEIVSFNKNNSV